VLVDDHLLLRVLLDDEPTGLRPHGGPVATTGLWYHRLCRALGNARVTGALSSALGAVDAAVGAATLRAVTALPDRIVLVSLRDLAWPMANALVTGPRLNLISLEAVAAAEYLDAEICLAVIDENPPLVAAASARGLAVRLLDS
jgi:hypothetical protein